MGLLFNGSTQFLNITSADVTAVPLTLSCWIQSTAITIGNIILCIGSQIASDFSIFDINLGGSPVSGSAETSNGTGSTDTGATSALGLSNNTVYHLAAVFTTITSRTIYVNGGNTANDVTSSVPTAASLNATVLAAIQTGPGGFAQFATAAIYFPAIWNAALSSADVTSLAAGISPRKIRPANLLRYARLTGHTATTEPDMMKSVGWTVNAAPTESANVRVFFP